MVRAEPRERAAPRASGCGDGPRGKYRPANQPHQADFRPEPDRQSVQAGVEGGRTAIEPEPARAAALIRHPTRSGRRADYVRDLMGHCDQSALSVALGDRNFLSVALATRPAARRGAAPPRPRGRASGGRRSNWRAARGRGGIEGRRGVPCTRCGPTRFASLDRLFAAGRRRQAGLATGSDGRGGGRAGRDTLSRLRM